MTLSTSDVTVAARRDAVPPPQADSPATSNRSAAAREGAADAKPAPERQRSALAEVNESLRMSSIGVQFEFDKEADTMIVKVVDVESGDLIRQMPSEEVVRISKALGKLQGLLVHQAV